MRDLTTFFSFAERVDEEGMAVQFKWCCIASLLSHSCGTHIPVSRHLPISLACTRVRSSSSTSSIIQHGALFLSLALCIYGPSICPQSIMDHNGGSVVAMAGKDCVAIASDLRLGAGAMTVAMNFEKVRHISPTFHYCERMHTST